MNIYVGNLNYHVNEDELREVFEEYGVVNSVKIITDKLSGRSKGFGFVEMPTDEEAQNAIDALNGAEIRGRSLTVNQSQDRRERRDTFRSGNNFKNEYNRDFRRKDPYRRENKKRNNYSDYSDY